MDPAFIFITGGVVSSLGKGIAAGAIGLLLKSRGISVVNQKFDPYLNGDPGTMNPYQHGEVFVTQDGGETDLDLGHYERFTDVPSSRFNSTTAGSVYRAILDRERAGGYGGATVQVIPHVTDEIQARIRAAAATTGARVVITEIGGTVGDIESLPFIEAIRQIRRVLGKERCLFIHLGLVPYLPSCGEMKTKPLQHSVKELLGLGVQPDVILCRSERHITDAVREKLSLFCNVEWRAIVENVTARSIYEVPLLLEAEGLGALLCERLRLFDTCCGGQVARNLGAGGAQSAVLGAGGTVRTDGGLHPAAGQGAEPDLTAWRAMVRALYYPRRELTVALVGKYVSLADAYLSVSEALTAAGICHRARVDMRWIDAEEICSVQDAGHALADADALVIPGGFGVRGIEGMICAVSHARVQNLPYLGICLGMQIAVIEFARNVLLLASAHSREFAVDTPHPVVDLLPGCVDTPTGGSLRLGQYRCLLAEGSRARALYGRGEVWERHRHRYGLNAAYRARFEASALRPVGVDSDCGAVEVVEHGEHPWFFGVQFHPEFCSRPNRAHPLFRALVAAGLERKDSRS
ncbi:CTP synthase [Treponema pallidum]|uniref:CTP synthase n=1 Tax=Treponema pallidum TaxID=160 RepID=UPI00158BBC73|nr:CTP synthase [Treponema pallidum]